ncbi:MAG: hypothetical protein HYY17_11565 [Planctomycetes bacterium]|nr:hypothetical protein [Planctomycetota bacterium]
MGIGFEHHAVIAKPADGAASSGNGVVFDPWIAQEPKTYPFWQWWLRVIHFQALMHGRKE